MKNLVDVLKIEVMTVVCIIVAMMILSGINKGIGMFGEFADVYSWVMMAAGVIFMITLTLIYRAIKWSVIKVLKCIRK